MKGLKGGFTLIEVSLFLAITGLLFLGVTVGVQNSIFQQRYNDSVQNFAEFLRSAYAKTENVQGNAKGGNSDKAMYGKLITFGEKDNDNTIYMYSLIGGASCGKGFNGALDGLKACAVDVVDENGGIYLSESYKPKWSAVIQDVEGNLFKGAILITRHPQSGTIYTFVKTNGTIEVDEGNGRLMSSIGGNTEYDGNNFEPRQVDFCVNPDPNNAGGTRADVRITQGSRNSSGVEVIFDEGNLCTGR